MDIFKNLPFFSILLCMIGALLASVVKKRQARLIARLISLSVLALSSASLIYCLKIDGGISFMMGHFPAPFGNEIRFSRLECLLASVFSLSLTLILFSGLFDIDDRISDKKQSFFYVMTLLALASLLVLIYTNDIFTAYVFIEINSIAACSLIIIFQKGKAIVAGTRYCIMNLIASGLTLLGISILYGITGHLLIPQLKESIGKIFLSGEFKAPLKATIILISSGLAIKSALYPFHVWAPDAYANSSPTSASILSGLVSKGYMFLLIKLYVRVYGLNVIKAPSSLELIFLFGVLGMILGSLAAIRQKDIFKMIAYSSVAQIGYVFLGLGLGTLASITAAIFHMLVHSLTKPVLFISAGGLTNSSASSREFSFLHGAGYRNREAGLAFTIGSLSMVGIPLTAGFISKIKLSLAGIARGGVISYITVLALALSTLLNTIYFLHTVVSLYRNDEFGNGERQSLFAEMNANSRLFITVFSLLVILLGLMSSPVLSIIEKGLAHFSL